MIEHLVLFQLKDGTADARVDEMLAALRRLRDEIPGIVELSCGRNFSDRSRGHHVGLLVRFETTEALAAYGPHPAHQGCVEQYIKPFVDGVTVVDFDGA